MAYCNLMTHEYDNLFIWQDHKILDVRYWCEPELLKSAISKISDHFPLNNFEGFVGLEAKAFYLTGVASGFYSKPTIVVRKYRSSYENREHQRIHFTNWRGETESLVTISRHHPNLKKVILLDDVIDTGASLAAACALLKKSDVSIVGAFYLADSRKPESKFDFDFPVVSLIQAPLF